MGIFDIFKKDEEEKYKGITLIKNVDTALQKQLIDRGRSSEIKSLAPEKTPNALQEFNRLSNGDVFGAEVVKPTIEKISNKVYSNPTVQKTLEKTVGYLNAVDDTSEGLIKRDDGTPLLTQDLPAHQQIAGAAFHVAKNIGIGEIGTAVSSLQGLQWLGADEVKPLTDKLADWQRAIAPEDPTFADQLAQGLGSAVAFFLPGAGAMKGAQAIGMFSPRLAALFGNSAMTAFEAMSEAGNVWQQNLDEGKSEKEASTAATKTFWSNAVLIGLTNQLAYFNRIPGAKKLLLSSLMEGSQEFGQQIISNWNTGKTGVNLLDGAFEAGAIGTILGGILGGTELTTEEDKSAQKKIIDQQMLNPKMVESRLVNEMAIKIDRILGETNSELSQKVIALKDTTLAHTDSPGQFYSEVAKVIKADPKFDPRMLSKGEGLAGAMGDFLYVLGVDEELYSALKKKEGGLNYVNIKEEQAPTHLAAKVKAPFQAMRNALGRLNIVSTADANTKENAQVAIPDKYYQVETPTGNKYFETEGEANDYATANESAGTFLITEKNSQDAVKLVTENQFSYFPFESGTSDNQIKIDETILQIQNKTGLNKSDAAGLFGSIQTLIDRENISKDQPAIIQAAVDQAMLEAGIEPDIIKEAVSIANKDIAITAEEEASKIAKQKVMQDGQFISASEARAQSKDFAFIEGLGLPLITKEKILTPQGKRALGRYSGAMIEFLQNPHKTTLPHEAVHAYLDLMTTAEEKAKILNEFKRRKAGARLTDAQAEELLAQEFARYYTEKQTNPKAKTLSTRIKNFFDRFIEHIKTLTGNQDIIDKFYKDILTKRPDAAAKERAMNKAQKGSLAQLREQYFQEPEALTSKILKNVDIANRETSSYAYLTQVMASMNKKVKQIEWEFVNDILQTPQFKNNPKINMEDFRAAIRAELMPLQAIETNTYADYGAERIGLYYKVKSKTYLFNSPFKHGRTGHFGGDFDEYLKADQVEIRTIAAQPNNPTAKFAVVRKDVELTEENLEENVLHLASSKEDAQSWIEDHDGNIRVGKSGLFSHIRTFDETINEDPIKEIEKRIGIRKEAISTSKENIGFIENTIAQTKEKAAEINNFLEEEIKKVWKEKEPNIGKFTGFAKALGWDWFQNQSFLVTSEQFYGTSKLKIKDGKFDLEGTMVGLEEELAYHKNRLSEDEIGLKQLKKELTDEKKIDHAPEEVISHIAEIQSDVFQSDKLAGIRGQIKKLEEDISYEEKGRAGYLEAGGKESDDTFKLGIKKLEGMRRELEELKNKKISILEKQFFSFRNTWHERSIREIIRIKALEGVKTLRFPTPYTVSLIEGYINDNEDGDYMPYEVISGDDQGGDLVVGDTIDYGGDEYQVVGVDGSSVYVADPEKIHSFSHSQAVDEEVDNRWDELVSEWEGVEKDFGKIDTAAKAEEVSLKVSAINTYIARKNAPKTIEEFNALAEDKKTDWQKKQFAEANRLMKKYPDLAKATPEGVKKELYINETNGYYFDNADRVIEKMANRAEDITYTLDDFEEEMREIFYEGANDDDYKDIYGEGHVFYEAKYGDTMVTVVDEDAHVEEFMQPDQYEERKDFDRDDFDYENVLGDSEATVARYYDKQVVPYLRKIRKDNLRLVDDDKGNSWWETDVVPEDQQAVEAFQTEDDIKEPIRRSGEEVVNYVEEVERTKDDEDYRLSGYMRGVIGNQEYALQDVKIKDLLKRDPDLKEYVRANEQRYPDGVPEEENIDYPIVVGAWGDKQNVVLDGYNRTLTKYQNGEEYIQAWVADPTEKFQTPEDIIKDAMTRKIPMKQAINIMQGKEQPITITKKESVLLRNRLRDMSRASKQGKAFGRSEMRNDLNKAFATRLDFQKTIRKAVAAYSQDLPISLRGTMLNSVAAARTPNDLLKAYARVDAALKLSDKKDQLQKMKVMAKRVKKAMHTGRSIAVDYQKKIADVINDYNLANPTAATIEKLNDLAAYIADNPDANIPEHLIKKLDVLKRKNPKDISGQDLEELNDLLMRLWSLGELKMRMKGKYNERYVRNAVNKLLSTTRDASNSNLASLQVLHAARVTDIFDGFRNYKGENVKLQKQINRAVSGSQITSKTMVEDTAAVIANIKNEFTLEEQASLAFHLLVDQGLYTQAQALVSNYAGQFGWKSEADIKNSPALQQTADILRGVFQENVDYLAAVYEEIENKPFIKSKNYFPIKYDWNLDKTVDIEAPTVNQMTDFTSKQVKRGFTFARVKGVKKVVRIDVFNVFAEAVAEQQYYMRVQPALNEVANIVGNKNYQEKLGKPGAQWWDLYLKSVANRGKIPNLGVLRSIEPWLKAKKIDITNAILGFKITSAFLQPTAIIDAYAYVYLNYGTIAANTLLVRLAGTLTLPYYAKSIVKKSPGLQLRTGGELTIREMQENPLGSSIGQAYRNAGMWALKALDLRTAAAVDQTMFKYFKSLGMSEADARYEADFVMNLTQGSSEIADLPLLLTSGEVARTFFTFQTFVLNRWGLIAHDIARSSIYHGGLSRKLKGLIALFILSLAGGIENVLRTQISQAISGKKYPQKFGFWAQSALTVPETVPLIGSITTSLLEYNQGTSIPLTRVFENLISGAFSVIKPSGETQTAKDTSRLKGLMKFGEAVATYYGVSGAAQFSDFLQRALVPISKSASVGTKKLGSPARPERPALPSRPTRPARPAR